VTFEELHSGAVAYRESKAKVKNLVKLLWVCLGVFLFVSASQFGVMIAAIQMAKDARVSSDGVMKALNGAPVQVASTDFYIDANGMLKMRAAPGARRLQDKETPISVTVQDVELRLGADWPTSALAGLKSIRLVSSETGDALSVDVNAVGDAKVVEVLDGGLDEEGNTIPGLRIFTTVGEVYAIGKAGKSTKFYFIEASGMSVFEDSGLGVPPAPVDQASDGSQEEAPATERRLVLKGRRLVIKGRRAQEISYLEGTVAAAYGTTTTGYDVAYNSDGSIDKDGDPETTDVYVPDSSPESTDPESGSTDTDSGSTDTDSGSTDKVDTNSDTVDTDSGSTDKIDTNSESTEPVA